MASSTIDRRPHVLTLVAATSTSALAMSVFIPALPDMASFFGVDYSSIQLTLSVYLVATTLVNLLAGPLSDVWGRRPALLACLLLFLIGTIGSVLAPNLGLLLVCRVLQAASAAALIIPRAIARDIAEPSEAATLISYITMGMALVPMLGPIIGAVLLQRFGWQSTFIFNFAFGLVATVLVFLFLPETSRGLTSRRRFTGRDYLDLLGSRSFWSYTGATTFVTSAYMAFIGAGSYVAKAYLQLSPVEYGVYFALNAGGYLLGTLISGQFARRLGIDAMIRIGGVICIVPLAVSILLFDIGLGSSLAFFIPLAVMGIGNGMVQPNAATGAVSARPQLAGAASGLCGSLQLGGSALASMLASLAVQPSGHPVPLLWIMLTCMTAGLISALLRGRRIDPVAAPQAR